VFGSRGPCSLRGFEKEGRERGMKGWFQVLTADVVSRMWGGMRRNETGGL
jgi:hypothetical protein